TTLGSARRTNVGPIGASSSTRVRASMNPPSSSLRSANRCIRTLPGQGRICAYLVMEAMRESRRASAADLEFLRMVHSAQLVSEKAALAHAAEDELLGVGRQAVAVDEDESAGAGLAGEAGGERNHPLPSPVIEVEQEIVAAEPQQVPIATEILVGITDVPHLSGHLRLRGADDREAEAQDLRKRRHRHLGGAAT